MSTARPNILVAIADDWAWPHAGAYGCRFVSTPVFDRLAREGVLFSNAFTTAPTCTASRASLLTGCYPWSLEAGIQLHGYLPAQFDVYPDLLERAGYWVGLTNKGWGPGSIQASGRQRNPAGPAFDRCRCEPLTNTMHKNDYPANFAEFLEQRPAGTPFCFWYGSKEPHRPYEAGSDVDVPPYLPDCPEIRSDLLDYALEAERFDRDLGRMLHLLEERDELDNTIVVVTGDNGCPVPRAKANIYENGCHIPLAIRWGGACPGRTVTDFVGFIDLAPTFLELAGVPAPGAMAGKSLLPLLTSQSGGRIDPARAAVATGHERHGYCRPDAVGYPMRSLVTDNYVYIRNFIPERWPAGTEKHVGDCDVSPTRQRLLEKRPGEERFYELCFGRRPAEELFRRQEDTGCLHNIIGTDEGAAVAAELGARLDRLLRDTRDPRVLGRGWEFDCVPYLRPRPTEVPESFPPLDPTRVITRNCPAGEKISFTPPIQ